MGWFTKKKPKEVIAEKQCIHEWQLADVGVEESNDCVTLFFDDYYVLVCEKCDRSRKVNDVEYFRIKRSGLLKEAIK